MDWTYAMGQMAGTCVGVGRVEFVVALIAPGVELGASSLRLPPFLKKEQDFWKIV